MSGVLPPPTLSCPFLSPYCDVAEACIYFASGITHSVKWLPVDWTTGVRSLSEASIFPASTLTSVLWPTQLLQGAGLIVRSDVKNVWSCTSAPLVLHGVVLKQ